EFVINTGNYKFTFNELSNLDKPIDDKKIQISGITSGGRYTLIFYTISKINGKRFSSFLAMYDNKTGSYHQNVSIVNKPDYLSVQSGDKVFPGFEDDCIILLRYPAEILKSDPDYNIKEDSNPVLIKYKLK
ncbi:MAG: hypothetical protein PHX13_12765, partial [Thiovulaceae bacterium]|nr:hypothetical protein [Sulfurimonadaceae bacterium]